MKNKLCGCLRPAAVETEDSALRLRRRRGGDSDGKVTKSSATRGRRIRNLFSRTAVKNRECFAVPESYSVKKPETITEQEQGVEEEKTMSVDDDVPKSSVAETTSGSGSGRASCFLCTIVFALFSTVCWGRVGGTVVITAGLGSVSWWSSRFRRQDQVRDGGPESVKI
ncbi:hypothetical protein DM860_009394 [Cuscuta australis]|uniref:Uncharacterized protein n=1 Tax=Cuscuta australis TaxID=267555 RepID=A0A328DAQ3_9ASTE|nr:hypothetical protein DM860_009394 [Cuscuta australis]